MEAKKYFYASHLSSVSFPLSVYLRGVLKVLRLETDNIDSLG